MSADANSPGNSKNHWQDMSELFGQSSLSRVCAGVVGLTTPELEKDVNEEVRTVKVDGQTLQQYLGGKTLEQNLERLRIFVAFREREGQDLRDYLTRFSSSAGKEEPIANV
jgi:puromycin-sensitive aminopeptidase